MEFPEPLLLDEELENQCNEIRAIASKNWLSSTHSSLQHLDKIKTSIYNVGIHDPKELKATNLSSRGQRSQSFTDLAVDPNAPPLSLQQNAIAWGSNASIPDLLAQHSARSQTNERLSSRRTRPSSGKKLRPQSAKESGSRQGSQLPPKAPSIGVKGARVDPTGRPPKFVPHTSTGWVGPPAGLKFADDFQTDIPNDKTTTGSTTPPVPAGTPIPSEFDHGDSVLGNQDTDRNEVKTSEPPKPPSPELIHFSLPRMEDDYDEEDSDLDTERLLSKAEMHAPSPAGFNYTHSTTHNSASGTLQASNQEDDFKAVTIPEEQKNKNTVSVKFDLVDDDENDGLEDDWDEELADLHHEESLPFVVPTEKTSVKFREDKNVTIDITPRNLGYKVADLDFHTKKKHISPKDDELQSFLSVRSTGPTKNQLAEGNHGNKHTADLKSSQQSYTKKPKPLSSVLKNRTEVHDTKCEKRLTQERPKSANKPSTPVAMVTVAYSDMEDAKKTSKSKSRKKHSEKDVITMVQTVQSETEDEEDKKLEEGSEDKITPDKLESWMPTKCVSDPPKNYYELSRRSASVQSHVREVSPPSSSHVYKTTKTIEFDEYKPKETSIKSVIDNSALLKSRDKERFVGLEEGGRLRARPSSEHPPHLTSKDRPAIRPRSAMIQKTKSNTDMEHSFTKGAHVTAHAEKTGAKRMLRRPLSAPSQRKALEFLEKEENKRKEGAHENQNISMDTKPVLSEKEKEIENLINKHLRRNNLASMSSKPMVPEKEHLKLEEPEVALTVEETNVDVKEITDNTPSEAEKVIETNTPSSAGKPKTVSRKTKKNYEDIETLVSGKCQHSEKTESSNENKVNRMVLKMAETQVNAKLSDNTRHYASYSRSRVRSAPIRRVSSEPKVRYTKPLYIHSKMPDDDVFTENEIEAHLIHERLASDNVYIRPETLERALYPPSGKTLYYDIENKLPRSTSASLLSHPKVWLPVEYKQFKLAEKNLNRANEIIRRQELAEERKARLAELGSVAKKKKGKKGKKKGTGKKKGETTVKKKSIC